MATKKPSKRPSSSGGSNHGEGPGSDPCECRSGPLAGSARVQGLGFKNRWLQYAEVDGDAVFEGDIVLGRVDELSQDTADADGGRFGLGVTGANVRWPNATVPYEIDAALPNPQRVNDAIAHWQANTPMRFVLRTAANAATFPDFVRFVPGSGCSSQVGRRGGRQNITLGTSCTTGNTIHEIGHTVGLWHEQSREDRDGRVTIVWANIDPAMAHNFNQHISDGDDIGAYDFGSIMHYPATAFSVNGRATIEPRSALPPGVVMGQRSGLSAGDIAAVRAMYPSATVKEVAKDPISDPVTIKEVRKDAVADPTLKEIRKDPISDPVTLKEIRKDPVSDPTLKELRKDPIADPTRKEVAFDLPQIPNLGNLPRPGGFDVGAGATPYVLAGASQFGGGGLADDALTQAAAEVERLALAHAQAQQEVDALAQAYEQALAQLQALQGGG